MQINTAKESAKLKSDSIYIRQIDFTLSNNVPTCSKIEKTPVGSSRAYSSANDMI